jgi:cell division protein FtsB
MQALKRTNQTIGKKDWMKGIILVIAWILIFSLAKDLWQVKKGYSRIDEAKNRLIEEEAKNQMLKDKLSIVTTEEYKEKIMREQLNMQKIGEVVAVLPKNDILGTTGQKVEEKTMENWEKWWSLLK